MCHRMPLSLSFNTVQAKVTRTGIGPPLKIAAISFPTQHAQALASPRTWSCIPDDAWSGHVQDSQQSSQLSCVCISRIHHRVTGVACQNFHWGLRGRCGPPGTSSRGRDHKRWPLHSHSCCWRISGHHVPCEAHDSLQPVIACLQTSEEL